jgi:hypothetical protein
MKFGIPALKFSRDGFGKIYFQFVTNGLDTMKKGNVNCFRLIDLVNRFTIVQIIDYRGSNTAAKVLSPFGPKQ